jgi:hypothetical protein
MGTLTIATTGTISGVAENTQINAMTAALATMSQGATAPTPTITGLSSTAGLWWHDITDGTIRIRNQADSAWITIGTLNESTSTFVAAGVSGGTSLALAGGTLTGALTVNAGGIDIVAGGLTVGAGGASITGNSSITGTLNVSGTVTFASTGSFGGALSVAGQITSTAGGIKFPDGTVQVTAVSGSSFVTTSALGAYAALASPSLSGSPNSPTPPTTDNSTRIATTAYVQAAIAAYAATLGTGGGTGGGTG